MHSYRKSGFLHIQYISIHEYQSVKKLATLLSNLKWFFWVQLHIISVHHTAVGNTSRAYTILRSVGFTLAILHTKYAWSPRKYSSPGHEALKVKPEILKSSHQHINDLSSPQSTNPLPQTGHLTIRAYLKKDKFLLVFIICDRRLNFWHIKGNATHQRN